MDIDEPVPSAEISSGEAPRVGIDDMSGARTMPAATTEAASASSRPSGRSAPAPRTLRARPSTSAPAAPSASPSSKLSSSSVRAPTEKESLLISRKVGPEALQTRRDELLKEKEQELRVVVDEHDTVVREKFHLEKYILMITGWDPEVAKADNSPVFLDYKRFNYNLFDLAPPPPPNAVAGPSRARHSLPGRGRTTRQQAHEQIDIISTPKPALAAVELPSLSNSKGKGRLSDTSSVDVKGKKRADPAVDVEMEEEKPKGKGKGRMKTERESMPPPSEPLRKKARASIAGGSTIPVETSVQRGKARASLPNLPGPASPIIKRGPGRPPKIRLLDSEPVEVVVELPTTSPVAPTKRGPGRPPKIRLPDPTPSSPIDQDLELEPTPSTNPFDDAPPPAPAPSLPSLAHIPFPPPPFRPRPRRIGPNKIWYTDPVQHPPPAPPHGGNLTSLLTSYIMLEDSGPPPELPALEARAARDGFNRNRVNWLQSQGRLLRLIDEADTDMGTGKASLMKLSSKPPVIARKQDYQDHLMVHMRQVRNAMLDEAKNKPVYCRRIARMVMAYWEHLEGRADREKAEAEREIRKKGREVIKALRRKWGLAVKVIKARVQEAQKAEQDRLGKEHLQNMLQRSTGLLEAQQQFEGGVDMEDEDSDGTDDVSSADSSDMEDGARQEAEAEGDEGEGEEDEKVEEVEPVNADAEEMEVDEVEGVFDLDGEGPNGEVTSPGPDLDGGRIESRDDLDEENEGSDDGLASESRSTTSSPKADIRDLLADFDESPVPSDNLEAGPSSTSAPMPSDDIGPSLSISTSPRAAPPVPTALPLSNSLDAASSPPSIVAPLAEDLTSSSPPFLSVVDAPIDDQNAPSPAIRSRRARKVIAPSSLLQEADPDADDVEFDINGDLENEQDEAMDVEMEEAEEEAEDEDGKVDSEDEGLLADADMPIEEVLRRYGVLPASNETDIPDPDPDQPSLNGHSEPWAPADQSLLDENLESASSPLVVSDGKRQRRVRQVWTPEDNPPPPPKRVRIEDVTETETRESTPQSSSEEESEEEDEEEEDDAPDEGAEGADAEMEVEEDPNAPKTRPPFLLRGTLRPYQHAGLDWLAGLYANNMNGILADEMGLGKTIQTISLLGHLACDRGIWGQHLIIVPTSVILNWEMEFKKFLPGFKVLTYYGNQKERKEKRVGWLTEHSWQVCITSYQIVLADQHIFRRKNWVYMILDEAHNIKNFRSQRWQTLLGFKAQRRLLLTGTPLQNNLMELWSLLYFLMPHGVAEEATAVVGFANHRDFVEWFSNPMDKAVESGDVLDEQAMATVSKLHTLLRPFILRRLKSEVEKQLPGKFEHVVYCRLSKRQRFLYDEFMSRSSTKDALTNGGYLGVMNTLMQLRKVCNHPDLFEVRPVRTSFAMDRSVAEDFTPLDIIVRKRLLASRDEVDVKTLVLDITGHERVSGWAGYARRQLDASDRLPHAIEERQKGRLPAPPSLDPRTMEGWAKYRAAKEEEASVARWRSLRDVNRLRCRAMPIYGSTFLTMLSDIPRKLLPLTAGRNKRDLIHDLIPSSSGLVLSFAERQHNLQPLVEKFAVIPPVATALNLASLALPSLRPDSHPSLLDPEFDTLHHASTKLQIAFPDTSLLQYDCGKLQKLAEMLRDLKAGGHRVLIFTQMTRVLDILEIFLNYNGHRYLRLDGSTKIEDRQIITERFNSDDKIFCFIASSRSGGVGINLTGADTVFFYDSDWNPSMDRQCMDRAHRIGQTREVHIYRFVSSHTVEENMLKKANQKRLLDKVIIQEGDFTTEFFGKVDWRDTLYDGDEPKKLAEEEEKDGVEDIEVEDEPEAEDVGEHAPRRGEEREFAKMVAEVEDEEDVQAARIALGEGEMDNGDFEAEAAGIRKDVVGAEKRTAVKFDAHASSPVTPGIEELGGGDLEMNDENEDEDDVGGVDEYMMRLVEWDWTHFASYR